MPRPTYASAVSFLASLSLLASRGLSGCARELHVDPHQLVPGLRADPPFTVTCAPTTEPGAAEGHLVRCEVRVEDVVSRKPVAFPWVLLVPLGGGNPNNPGETRCRSDAPGRAVCDVKPGIYTLSIQANGYFFFHWGIKVETSTDSCVSVLALMEPDPNPISGLPDRAAPKLARGVAAISRDAAICAGSAQASPRELATARDVPIVELDCPPSLIREVRRSEFAHFTARIEDVVTHQPVRSWVFLSSPGPESPGSPGETMCASDMLGRAECDVPPGEYTVGIQADGYYAILGSVSIRVSLDTCQTAVAALEPNLNPRGGTPDRFPPTEMPRGLASLTSSACTK